MQPDIDVIRGFLNRIGTRQRHSLAYIHHTKTGLEGATFEARQMEAMLKQITIRQSQGYGIYYSLNEGVPVFKQRGFNGKLLADEIIKVHMMGFDIDWITGNEEERRGFEIRAVRLMGNAPEALRPKIIVSTGGGVQFLYTFAAPLEVALSGAKVPSEAEAIADKVAKSFRDDFTLLYADIVVELSKRLSTMIESGVAKIDKLSNIDRVFRMPGTINFPTEAKIAKGATIRMARIIYDKDEDTSFFDLREAVPKVTTPIVRVEPRKFEERPGQKWTYYTKAKFLCEFIKDNALVNDNEDYTHALMFPLFGMINRNEITAAQGRELWLLATSTGRTTAYGTWAKKWDTRKIANYTGRDLGSTIHFCRQHDCLLPWSNDDQETAYKREAAEIAADSLRRPVLVDETDLF